MKTLMYSMLFCATLISCKDQDQDNNMQKWKNEIMETEREFAAMAAKEGIAAAFSFYSADDAVIHRNDSLIIGKEAIKEFYGKRYSGSDGISLTWEPDFTDVSASGDLGYTYGKYLYTVTDSLGNSKSFPGVFQTVWKRQQGGEWKFVWD